MRLLHRAWHGHWPQWVPVSYDFIEVIWECAICHPRYEQPSVSEPHVSTQRRIPGTNLPAVDPAALPAEPAYDEFPEGHPLSQRGDR